MYIINIDIFFQAWIFSIFVNWVFFSTLYDIAHTILFSFYFSLSLSLYLPHSLKHLHWRSRTHKFPLIRFLFIKFINAICACVCVCVRGIVCIYKTYNRSYHYRLNCKRTTQIRHTIITIMDSILWQPNPVHRNVHYTFLTASKVYFSRAIIIIIVSIIAITAMTKANTSMHTTIMLINQSTKVKLSQIQAR